MIRSYILISIVISIILISGSILLLKDIFMIDLHAFTKFFPTILFSGTTLILAILLFDRVGIRKFIYEKKVNAVVELLEEIKALQFMITGRNTNNNTLFAGPRLFFSLNYTLNSKIVENFNKTIVFLPEDMIDIQLKFRKLQQIPFLPKQIADSLSFLQFGLKKDNSADRIEAYTKPEANFIVKEFYKSEEDMTLQEFYIGFKNTLKIIKKWIDKHSNENHDLNF